MKTKEEILDKLNPVFYDDAPMSTGVAYEKYDVLSAMEEYARIQIKKDREYFINKISYCEANYPGELVDIRMAYEARPIILD